MDDFERMNYRDLQRLAKTAGVKANLPKADLIKALQDNAANDSFKETEDGAGNLTEDGAANITEDGAANMTEDLNSTFEVEEKEEGQADVLNRTFDKENDSEVLNQTFEKDTEGTQKRRSGRLSVGNITKATLTSETVNSPKPRKASSGGKLISLPVPARAPTLRVEKPTPRSSKESGARILKPMGRKSVSTPKSVTKMMTPSLKSIKKPTLGSSVKKLNPGPSATKHVATTNIPRFVKFARKVPDFSKMHEKEFKKMESLDTYLDKKRKRTETVQEQLKLKAATLTEEHNKIVEKLKARTPGSKFVPTVTSTTKMNLNFGSKTPGTKEPFKFSAAPAAPLSTKKPERAQTGVKTLTKEKSRPAPNPKAENTPKPTKSETARTPVVKPLFNITNKSVNATPSSTKKTFDLKASLAKPLGYKPHVGKLPTWGEKKVT